MVLLVKFKSSAKGFQMAKNKVVKQNEFEAMLKAYELVEEISRVETFCVGVNDSELEDVMSDELRTFLGKKTPTWNDAIGIGTGSGEIVQFFLFDAEGLLLGQVNPDDMGFERRKK